MKKLLVFFMSIACFDLSQLAIGQTLTPTQLAVIKCDSATKLADKGNIDQSIRLLKEAVQLDPSSVRYPSELAYSYYLRKDFPAAISLLDQLASRSDADEKLFVFLGSLYTQRSEPQKALETYRIGVQRFPQSAVLYASLASGLMKSRSYYSALENAENGIQADPSYADNYYLASQIYCHSTEKVWGMLYGEIYLCLDQMRDSAKSHQLSQLLYATFQGAVHINEGENIFVNFSDIAIGNGAENDVAKLPFQVGVYENLMLNAAQDESVLDLYTINLIRTRFLKSYFEKEINARYPNVLLEYQAEIANAGFLDVYNTWLFQAGSAREYAEWLAKNGSQYAVFQAWLKANPITLNRSHFFNSSQYSWKEKPQSIKIERKITGLQD